MRKINLSTRFTLILSGVFLLGIAIGGTAYWRALQGKAQEQIASQGTLLIEAMNSVRGYTSTHVKPLLADQLASSATFIPETVPAFSARSVFENFRGQKNFESYSYKEAAFNPTNTLDTADDFEAALLQKMIDTNSGEQSGYRETATGRLFYIARPLKLGADSCLECHSTPDKAPASLLATYGNKAGFGWTVGQIIAVQIIYVPPQKVFDAAWQTFLLVMSVFIIIFALTILLINSLLRRYVIGPVRVLGGLAQKISADENIAPDLEGSALHSVTTRVDELGNLAQVFKKMAADVFTRTGKLKEQVQQLIIRIDEIRRKEQVSQVVESEFFSDLQKRATEMRKRESGSEDVPPETEG